jgi:ABC-type uncharacterized transport system fused permease/ATPase subunit
MAGKGWSDEDLLEVLDTVHLAHILAREGGWDTAADWKVWMTRWSSLKGLSHEMDLAFDVM